MTYNNPQQFSAVIFAGGNSTRMGQDKAFVFGVVDRIRQLFIESVMVKSMTRCGGQESASLFEGEVWPDSKHCQ